MIQPNINAERITGSITTKGTAGTPAIKAIAYALTVDDETIEVSTAGATQTLPDANTVSGSKFRIINASTGIVRVTSVSQIGNLAGTNPTFIDLLPEEWLDVQAINGKYRIL
jgi:cytoskeletal protein RodZ